MPPTHQVRRCQGIVDYNSSPMLSHWIKHFTAKLIEMWYYFEYVTILSSNPHGP